MIDTLQVTWGDKIWGVVLSLWSIPSWLIACLFLLTGVTQCSWCTVYWPWWPCSSPTRPTLISPSTWLCCPYGNTPLSVSTCVLNNQSRSYGSDLVGKTLHMLYSQYNVCWWPWWWKEPGPRLNIKTVLSAYGDFHVKDKTDVRTSYL